MRLRLPARTALAGLFILLHLSLPPLLASPVISEFLAINEGSIRDADGDRSDWVEIRNTSGAAINLAGYSLTDDATAQQKWTFPSHILEGNGFVIVFASGKNRSIAGAELHTNFSLNSDGEYLALTAPGASSPVSVFAHYPAQFENVSYGENAIVTTTKVIDSGDSCRWIVPTSSISNWNDRTFNDLSWNSGVTGVGYENSTALTYTPLIGAGSDTLSEMFNSRTSAYIRIPFDLAEADTVSQILLKMKYDDGFVAYINGELVASDRAPAFPNFNSISTANHDDADAIVFSNFEVVDIPTNLIDGQNILAIHGLNRASDSSDFLMLPELEISQSEIDSETVGYHTVLTPGTLNSEAFTGLIEDTKFSIDRGFFSLPINVAITTATTDAQIRYTTNGAPPTATTGNIYSSPIRLSTTTVLRAAAFKPGYAPTNVDSQTYIFTNSVRTQTDMDPAITNSGQYSNLMDTALRGNIPIVSIATQDEGFFGANGIYTNSENTGRAAEVPISLEYFTPTGDEEFQIDAGVRIHGGNARSHPKKPLRLYFRRDYGEAKLRYPLYPGSPVDEFDQLLLRGGGHDSWSLAAGFGRADNDLPPHGTIMRDQFIRKTETEIGILSPRGKYVHVYINGNYWGVYDLHERANEDFFADHGGGPAEDYDVLHHPEFIGEDYSLVSGSDTAWNEMQALASAGITNETQYDALKEYLDVDSYIIAMITRMWSGDYDWCGPISQAGVDRTVFDNKNWYAGRRSRGADGRFKFFCWDAEMSMGLHLMVNLGNNASQRVSNFNLTNADDPGSPVALYDNLRDYLEFRVRFGDLLQKHLFNEGAMSPANNLARFEAMEDEIENAMIAESARWGDEGFTSNVFDRDEEWRSEVNWLTNTYLATRNDTLISQFRQGNLFPTIDAPVFSRRTGSVPVGTSLRLSGSGGTILYTTDGSDPRLIGGNINPSAQTYTSPITLTGSSVTVRARVRSSVTRWSSIEEATLIIGQAANSSNLAITEVHYHPTNPTTTAELAVSSDDTDFEFIEITNTSDSSVTMTNMEFDQGISFSVDAENPIQEILPGQRLLIVSNREAFLARYGQTLAPLILGAFTDDTKLSNNGETITLNDAAGQPISSFRYSDSNPWPVAADGTGPSMVLRDPIAAIDPSIATSWKASVVQNGTPGSASVSDYSSWAAAFFDPADPNFASLSAPEADPDNDGRNNLTEYALGSLPLAVSARNPISPGTVSARGLEYASISYSYQPVFSDVTITVESSTDLDSWNTANTILQSFPVAQSDGTTRVELRLTESLDQSKPLFLRLKITQ